MVMDMPPQTEVVADVPETNNENRDGQFNFSDYSGYAGEPFEIDSSVVSEKPEQLNENTAKRPDGRIVIDLKKTSHTYSGFSHIKVSHTGGAFSTKSGVEHTDTKITSTETKTAYQQYSSVFPWLF